MKPINLITQEKENKMMRLLAALVIFTGFVFIPAAQAKTINIPKGSIQINQLHDELLEKFPAWRGAPQTDGSFVNPVLGVKHTDTEIILEVPDSASEADINKVISKHKPKSKKKPAKQVVDPLKFSELEARIEALEALASVGSPGE